MEIQPPEPNLWQFLEAASQSPETANLQLLCIALEQTIAAQPLGDQLQIAGDALVQLSEVYAAKAELMISGWERQHRPTEPVVDLAGCVDLFVQSLSLDIADLFEEPDPIHYPAHRKKAFHDVDGSIAGEVDKELLLNWVDQVAAEPSLNEQELADQIKNLAHDENVEEWSRTIAQYLKHVPDKIGFIELQQAIKMPIVEVWLGLLLGGYSLEQQGEFYNPNTLLVLGTREKL